MVNKTVPTLSGANRREFARRIVDGESPEQAGKAAGYSSDDIAAALDSPALAVAIRTAMAQKLATITGPMAIKVLSDIAKDVSVLPGVRRQAATDLADRAGYIPRKEFQLENRSETALLSDMSTDKLAALVNRLESELADRARPISDSPGRHSDPQPRQPYNNPLNVLD
jgi:hypothetical protein